MEHGGLSERSLRPSEVRQVHLITTASTEAHVEHDGCNVVLGHTLEHIGAATDAVLHGNILNLPVMAQQPHPYPNYAQHTAAARLVAAT